MKEQININKPNSFVIIVQKHTYPYYHKNISYCGEQLDDGTIARQYVETMNKNTADKAKLYIWDMSNVDRYSELPEKINMEIKKVVAENKRAVN